MRVPLHVVNERRERLATLLREHAYLPVHELCTRLGVSEATARRDLASLAQNGEIIRTFGGALSEFNQHFASFRQRQKQNPEAKRAIARLAASQIKSDETVYLDAGTTAFAIAEELAERRPKNLRVITNNLPVAERLVQLDNVEVCLPGGQWLHEQSVLLGRAAIRGIAFYDIDLAILGAEGFDSRGVWNTHRDVVLFQKEVMKRAKRNILCLDKSKLQHSTPEKLAEWSDVGTLITDATPAFLKKSGIHLSNRLILAKVK